MNIFFIFAKCKKGMSLVEMMVSVSLFVILMGAVMGSVSYLYRVNGYVLAQTFQVDHARRGMDMMVRDIREMTYADNGAFPLVEIEPHRIGFYSDIDRDFSVEYVEYVYNGTNSFEKHIYNVAGSPPTYNFGSPDTVVNITEYAQNQTQGTSTFLYFAADGTEITDEADIIDVRNVVMQLIVNIDPVRDPGQFLLRQNATIRNLINGI